MLIIKVLFYDEILDLKLFPSIFVLSAEPFSCSWGKELHFQKSTGNVTVEIVGEVFFFLLDETLGGGTAKSPHSALMSEGDAMWTPGLRISHRFSFLLQPFFGQKLSCLSELTLYNTKVTQQHKQTITTGAHRPAASMFKFKAFNI